MIVFKIILLRLSVISSWIASCQCWKTWLTTSGTKKQKGHKSIIQQQQQQQQPFYFAKLNRKNYTIN